MILPSNTVSYRAHGLPVSENLLEQDFYASGPNQKWAGDITYLRTDEGWLWSLACGHVPLLASPCHHA
ncbi:transposase insF for insertion sequence IS3A/B/C/D/E/fA domain protein [Shigella flexneri K-227]|uniref:Transposase insF for insertion sequence IS3A/B/C/D/E/fA domain protein n=1 Tax=Shigella flexneri K-227 TaxID=766147 RepID=F5P1A3_SHIFL|nr:transposase insF for insertion sequence IS3A/B/C/D/E/fA domain protein [Shigella flexneri K-227]